jgi:chorismate--pyruvate lyase
MALLYKTIAHSITIMLARSPATLIYLKLKTTRPLALNHWHSYRRTLFFGTSATWRDWLLDQGSLTKRLILASNGDFRVVKLKQGWGRPSLHEARRLNMKPRQLAIIREVILVCRGEPWVYARSIFPLETLIGPLRWLKSLDARPLGDMLFKDPSMRRTLFEIAILDNMRIEQHTKLPCHKPVWGRRSLFFLKNKPILVAEIFLPALEQHAQQIKISKL